MRRERAPRRMTVDDTVWLWNVRHRHPDCRTVLSLRRTELPHAQLRLVFRTAPGRIVSGYPFGQGDVASADGPVLNLNEPGVVRRFLGEAGNRGLLPTTHGVREENAWPLYDTLTGTEAPDTANPA
ncbi:hypothetical protein [Streptomyces sp. NPDC058664]|uniref:hypothetical protein n=1 Tax=unclassified Streptomyces TaxID=2593676 RepID=UPI0036536BE7